MKKRQQFKELKEEAKQKNYERTAEEKTKFFWRVKNKIMKWYINYRYKKEKKIKEMEQLQKEVMK